MTHTTTPRSVRSTRRVAKAAVVFSIVVGVMFGGAAAAFAETDTLGSQCIYVGGYNRGCASNLNVQWGSGWYWRVGATASNTYRGDGWNIVVEAKLNRKWSSNTYWMRVSRVDDLSYYTSTNSISGYDPTYGAWVRLCAVTNSGYKVCNSSRYVTDNS